MWPRCTVTPSGGTSQILMVLFSLAEDRLGQVAADLLGVDVERGDELDVAHVVRAELDVHEAGHLLRRVGVAVVVDALDERRGAVADADDATDTAGSSEPIRAPPSECWSAVVGLSRVR